MIKTVNLQKRVPMAGNELEILGGISLEIKSGESVAIVGASGSGKSTLLGLLAGLDEATAGSVCINDTDLGLLDEDGRAAFRARHIGFVFQSFQLLPALTALENVMLPLELQGQDKPSEQAGYYLERVGLADRMTHYPRQMSGGEQQIQEGEESPKTDDHPLKGVSTKSLAAPGPLGTRPEHATLCFACDSNQAANRLARAMLATEKKIQQGDLIPEAEWVKRAGLALLHR